MGDSAEPAPALPALPDPNLSVVNLQELARHAPDSNGGGYSSQKRLQEAVLVQQARRNTLREMAGEGGAEGSGAGSEAADRGSNAAARDGVERETHSPNRQVSPSASVPSHLGTKKCRRRVRPLRQWLHQPPCVPALQSNLSVVNLTELARHQQQPTTSTTQKRLNKINTWKKTKAMKEKYGQSERRASFLSRLLSMLWTNRSYLFVAASVAWLNSRDRLRAEMVRRARGLGEQAKRMRDKVAAEGLDAGLEVMRTTVVRTWSESVAGYFRSRPRTTFGILVIVAFQITKAIVYFRGKSRRDPRDRLQKYPASVERKADTYKTAEEDGVEDGNNGSMTTWRGQNDPDSPLKGASLGASVTSSGSIDDLGEIIEHGGLHNLMTELNENGVHFNRKTLQLLRSMRHFACIGDADSAAIYKEMKHVRFERGQIIVRQGDPVTDGMFIVLRQSHCARNIYSSDNSSEKDAS